MAIFPLLYSSVINLDVIATSTFQAGMALIRDNNNRAVKADSQQLLTLTSAQKYAKFIGFASSDHDVNNNTIITPDVIGSGFVDVISSRLAYQKDTEFSSPKRALMDLQDETVSKYFNPSDTTNIGKRGIGIYNQVNDVFITDQFVRVLHGDYGLDSTTLVDLNPGDLLTFGGGVNAGKLVKVNTDSFGPDVLVIGVVEKYISSTNLLHFRQANYSLSFGSGSSTVFALDAGLTTSYPGSGTVWYDLSGNARNFSLINGPAYSASNSGLISFDGADDLARLTYTFTQSTFSLLFWFNSRSFSTANGLDSIISNDGTGGFNGFDFRKEFSTTDKLQYSDYFGSSGWITRRVGTITDNSWYLVVATYDEVRSKVYLNNTLTLDNAYAGPKTTGPTFVEIANQPNWGSGGTRTLSCFVSEVRYLSKALSATEVSAYYNATKSRYGL